MEGYGANHGNIAGCYAECTNRDCGSGKTEGAGRTTIFRKITVPMISPMVFLTMILSTISAFTAFDVFLTMFDVYSLPDRNSVVNLMVYREAFMYGKWVRHLLLHGCCLLSY